MNRGAKVVKEPWEESDENGSVTFATIQTVCDDCFMRPTGYKLKKLVHNYDNYLITF